jgi:anti-anti-sigma factor
MSRGGSPARSAPDTADFEGDFVGRLRGDLRLYRGVQRVAHVTVDASLVGVPTGGAMSSATPRALQSVVSLASRERVRYALQVLVVAGVYTGAGKLGLQLAFATRSVTAIWPPTGIALTALVIGGYRLWPAVALGALATNLDTGVSAVTLLGIVCGNTLEALTGAVLLRRVAGFRPSLQRVRDVFALIVLGAVVSTAVSATIGVTSLLIGGEISAEHLGSVWRTWWLGDMGGDLIVAPALLIVATRRSQPKWPGRPLEALALTLLLIGVSALVFSQSTNAAYAVFPLLIWASLRFWQAGAAAGSLIVAAVAVSFTANGQGPFATSGPDERLLLAQTFVSVAGIAALVLAAVTRERRRAEDAERHIAETLQQSLLPDAAPSIPGWEIATMYRAAGAAEVHVGGDFYDVFSTDAGAVVILGDVAGKGVEAAAMAALVRNGARFISQTEHGPAAILARLDEALRQRRTLSLCSALCVRLHAGHLVLSSAGHPPPLIVRRDGRLREIGGGGPILGVMPSGEWPERTVHLEPAETVLLYTDGVTDTRSADDRFGLPRLRALLVDHAGRTPRDLLGEIEMSLERFQLGPQSDDTAALALRLAPSPVVAPARARAWRAPRRRVAIARVLDSPTLSVQTLLTRGLLTVEAIGEIDHATAGRLLDAFSSLTPGVGSELVLDLAGVTFVDSVGLRTVIYIKQRVREQGLSFRMVSPPAQVRAVFRLSGLEGQLGFAEPSTDESREPDYAERVQLELAVSEQAAHQARLEVREAIDGKLSRSDEEVAVLLTSELVTNALLHPGDRKSEWIGLRISTDRGRARVEVADSGSGFDPTMLKRDERAVGGLGLRVVDRGAVRWGIIRDDRFRVWFELAEPRA